MTDAANISIDGASKDYPILPRHRRPRSRRHPQALRQHRPLHLRPRLHQHRRAAKSKITYIDGDVGILLYRGYPIDQLAEQSSFLEVAYLLLNGELPNAEEHAEFTYTITRHTMIHEQLATILSRLPPRRPPDGDHVRHRRRAWRPSITIRPTSMIRSSA